MGAWTPWLRDWADLIRLSFLVGACVLLLVGDVQNAVRLLLTFAVSLVPRLIGMPLRFDVAFGVAMSLQAWGNVSRLFWTWAFYHNIVHFLLTMATAVLVYFVLVFLRFAPDLSKETAIHQKAGIAVLAFAIGSTVNAIYEEYEWFADHVLSAHLLENYSHDIHDLLFGGLGSIAAAVWLVAWAGRGWRTRRPVEDDPLGGLRTSLERRMERGARDPSGPRSRARQRRRRVSTPASPFESTRLSRLVFGDWTRLIRDFSDLARVSLLVGFALSALAGNWQQAARFGFSFVASVGARWIGSPRAFDAAFNVALMFEAWGDFAGAFQSLPGYEEWTHFVLALAFAPLLYLVLLRAQVFPEFADEPRIHRRVALFIAATCLGFCAGIYYELYVWLANHALGADVPTSWNRLTGRLGLDWLGSAAGATLLLVWDGLGWGTRRRVPQVQEHLPRAAPRSPEHQRRGRPHARARPPSSAGR